MSLRSGTLNTWIGGIVAVSSRAYDDVSRKAAKTNENRTRDTTVIFLPVFMSYHLYCHLMKPARSGVVLALNRHDLGDALAVALLFDFRGEPCVHDLAHQRRVDGLASEREDVGVVVLARVASQRDRVARGGAHARHFVGRH